jgi:hypothetical protein
VEDNSKSSTKSAAAGARLEFAISGLFSLVWCLTMGKMGQSFQDKIVALPFLPNMNVPFVSCGLREVRGVRRDARPRPRPT